MIVAPAALKVACPYCKARPEQQCHKPDSLKGMGIRVHKPRLRLLESIHEDTVVPGLKAMTIVASDGEDTFHVKLEARDTDHAIASLAEVIDHPVTVHGVYAGTLRSLL